MVKVIKNGSLKKPQLSKRIDLSKAEQIAIECENTALSFSKKIKQSEGAAVNSNYSQFIFANSSGFIGGYGSSVHSLSCSVLAEENNNKERDYWWSSARDSNDLLSPLQVGEKASHRSLRRLNSRKISIPLIPILIMNILEWIFRLKIQLGCTSIFLL